MSTVLDYYKSLCRSCATEIYQGRPPTPDYIERATMQLYATGLHESDGFVHSRQLGFVFDSGVGGHGFWQIEPIAIRDCIQRLDRSLNLRLRVATWYFQSRTGNVNWYKSWSLPQLLQETCANPRMSLLWARLVYLRDPEPFPATLEEQARYWGRVYNTRNEETKIQKYISDYKRFTNGETDATV